MQADDAQKTCMRQEGQNDQAREASTPPTFSNCANGDRHIEIKGAD
jgi:hypothetical protein